MSTHEYLCNKLGLHRKSGSEEKRVKRSTGGRIRRKDGGETPTDMSYEKPAVKDRIGYVRKPSTISFKDRPGSIMPKSEGGSCRENHDIGDVVGKVKADAEDVGNKIKNGAEDVGNKIKNGSEDTWNKTRNFFHFDEGGQVPAAPVAPAAPAAPVAKNQAAKKFFDMVKNIQGPKIILTARQKYEQRKAKENKDKENKPLKEGGRANRAMGGAGKTRKGEY